MASIVSAGTTSATALNMSADTSGVLQLASNNGTVAVTVNTSQNVGIGTASPNAKLEVYGQRIRINSASDPGIEIANAVDIKGYLFYNTGGADVVTLRHASSTGLNLDASGRMTVPGQPLFTASISTNPSSTAGGIVAFDTAPVNVGSSFNTSTYTFTAPVAGYYMFAYGIRVDGFTSGNYFHFRILKNGATSTGGGGWYGGDYINIPSSSTYAGAYTTCVLYLAASDTIKIRNDCAISAGTYLGYQCWFNGYLLG